IADINAPSPRCGYPQRKRARIDSYLEESSSAEEDSTETAEVVPEAAATTKKKVPEQGSERHMPCGPCVTRAFTTPGQTCYNQGGLGVACWQCAKGNKTCVPVPLHIQSKLKAWWDKNRTEKEDASRTNEFMEELHNIIREIRAHKKGNAQPPLPAAPGSSSAGQLLFSTLPRNSPNTETAEEKEHSIRKVEALEAIANSATKSAEALDLLVKNTDQMKDSLKYSGSADSEEEKDSSPSPSPSADEESPSTVKGHYLSLLSERHDLTDKPLISISDRDALLALAAARDDTIGGLLQRKYIVAKARHGMERSRHILNIRAEQRNKELDIALQQQESALARMRARYGQRGF
ncbi:hypothetical protein B0H65DRAFT_426212, partial [Neurospora tetraspora]